MTDHNSEYTAGMVETNRHTSWHVPGGTEKAKKTPSKLADNATEIQTKHHTNRSLECYHNTPFHPICMQNTLVSNSYMAFQYKQEHDGVNSC